MVSNSKLEMAVDGHSVTHTKQETGRLVAGDLEHVYRIKSIRIMNRTDCCGERLSDFHVLVSDHPFTSRDLNATLRQPGMWNYHFSGSAGQQTDIPVHQTGRFVRVQLSGVNYLSLAEVQVFSE
jgi:alpha-L-fucosidase 2